ncbi:hypothetical protein TWF694_003078 [Orbilia ellipsospora]|uniref:Uncharacterized protein n=1 Tax=Orbilia ellipsospora TaxID=2528407 RepID=A0AAV9X0H1_9PEZI
MAESHTDTPEFETSKSGPKIENISAYLKPPGAQEPVPKPNTTLANRIGLLSAIIFFGSSVFAIICMGWFAFLWWGTIDNSVWHRIVINDWATRAISLPSSFFRMAVVTQAGIALSMLAAIAIERSYVPLSHLPAVSIMRATAPSTTSTIFGLIFPLAQNSHEGRGPMTFSVIGLASLITLTTTLLGFTSTILISDSIVKPIPNGVTNVTVPLDFHWVQNSGQIVFDYYDLNYWQALPPVILPAFGEYSAAPLVSPGMVDTGPTIRAFLPFTNSKDRGQLHSYKGKAILWDGRVICQKPQISNYQVYTLPNDVQGIKGTIKNALPFPGIIEEASPAEAQFWCSVHLTGGGLYYPPLICELPLRSNVTVPVGAPSLDYSGGLKSEFRTANHTIRPGTAYLVLNRTELVKTPQQYLDENPEWGVVGHIPAIGIDYIPEGIILGTLCYTAMDAVDQDVEISNSQPIEELQLTSYVSATDPSVINDPALNLPYQFDTKILSQLIPSASNSTNSTMTSLPQRGVLSLKQPLSGWATPESTEENSDGPWTFNLSNPYSSYPDPRHVLIQLVDLTENLQGSPSIIRGNESVSFFQQESTTSGTDIKLFRGSSWIAQLYLAVQSHPHGNAAVALQSVFTVLLSTAYYNYLAQFEKYANISITTFQNVSSPGGPFGQRRGSDHHYTAYDAFPVGYTIVAITLGLHILFTTVAFLLFMSQTRWTRIGDTWQAVAHVVDHGGFSDVRHLLAHSQLTYSDRETVKKELETGRGKAVQMGIVGANGAVKLVRRGGRGPEDLEDIPVP